MCAHAPIFTFTHGGPVDGRLGDTQGRWQGAERRGGERQDFLPGGHEQQPWLLVQNHSCVPTRGTFASHSVLSLTAGLRRSTREGML